MALVAAAGLAIAGLGYRVGVAPVVVGLFALGVGNGTWDVAMNVEGSAVEQRAGPGDHAALPRGLQPRHGRRRAGRRGDGGARRLRDRAPARGRRARRRRAARWRCATSCPTARLPRPPEEERRNPLQAWTEPRTLLIGLFVFAAAFTEGTGNDWLGVAMIDGYDARRRARRADVRRLPHGDDARPLVRPRPDRPPRARAARCASSPRSRSSGWRWSSRARRCPVAMAGAALWGLGTALGFPVGMSAAGDEPAHAAGAGQRGGHDRLHRVPRRARR